MSNKQKLKWLTLLDSNMTTDLLLNSPKCMYKIFNPYFPVLASLGEFVFSYISIWIYSFAMCDQFLYSHKKTTYFVLIMLGEDTH